MATTSRWALRYPVAADDAKPHTDLQNLATDADAFGKDDQGVFASRPVSTGGSPGKYGRYYNATDIGANGILYRDFGTGWRAIGGQEIFYGEIADIPGSVSITATTEATATEIITTGTLKWDSGTPLWVDVMIPQIVRSTATVIQFFLRNTTDSVTLATLASYTSADSSINAIDLSRFFRYCKRFTPPSGDKVLKFCAAKSVAGSPVVNDYSSVKLLMRITT